VEVKTPEVLADRVEVVRRRDAFEQDRAAFVERWQKADERITRQITAARKRLPDVAISDGVRERISTLCAALGTDGLRGDLTLIRAARALAALQGDAAIGDAHFRRIAAPALRHRLRRNPLDNAGSGTRVERAVNELLA
jgi:magnesium chelatase subunit I